MGERERRETGDRKRPEHPQSLNKTKGSDVCHFLDLNRPSCTYTALFLG